MLSFSVIAMYFFRGDISLSCTVQSYTVVVDLRSRVFINRHIKHMTLHTATSWFCYETVSIHSLASKRRHQSSPSFLEKYGFCFSGFRTPEDGM